MKHDIDLWGEDPADYRSDNDRNAKLLNIVFVGGTFGNFLNFFLEKFSTKTPEMYGDPFTEIGTSHDIGEQKYSGLIQRYHAPFITANQGESDLQVCIITPSTKKHYLYLKKAQWFRPYNRKISCDDLWKKAFGEMPKILKESAIQIKKIYSLKETEHFTWIPKFIVRDWYKLEFLHDLEDTYTYQLFETFKKHEFFNQQRVFELDLETFFHWETFIKNIKELDNFFGLDLDYDRHNDMKTLFDKGLELDEIRKECNLVESVLEHKEDDIPLNDLDVSTEGFIYAEMEKANDFIQMPLTNRFFRDADEMKQFIDYYPEHYKAMNPNMPKFNGIPNPYYLDKDK